MTDKSFMAQSFGAERGVAGGAGVYGVPLPMKRRRVASAAMVHSASPALAWSALHWARTSFSRSGLAISDSTDSVDAGLLHAASSRVQAATVRRAFMVEFSVAVVVDGGRRVGRAVSLEASTHLAGTFLYREPSRRSALFKRAAVAISSPCVALSRSGPRNRAVRWNEPSLLSTTPGATSPAQGNQSASRAGRVRYSARCIMVFASNVQQRAVLDVSSENRHELRIQARAPHRQ